MSTDPARAWSLLRILRSDPPGSGARTSHRRQTFAAALEQAERLWQAAGDLPPTASPIVLFYALTQAATALCAATLPDGGWEGAPSHGLTLLRPDTREGHLPSLSEIEVKPHGTGFVHQVAEYLQSPVLESSADLASVLCSLPENEAFLLPEADLRRRPLRVVDQTQRLVNPMLAAPPFGVSEMTIGPLPSHLVGPLSPGEEPDIGTLAPAVVAWFRDYPSLANVRDRMEIRHVTSFDVHVRWTPDPPDPLGRRGALFARVVDVAVHDAAVSLPNGLVLPRVGGNHAAQHPLIGWWTVLYALSMLARYHPRTWVRLLDLDKSRSAVPLGLVLATARDRLPVLVFDALSGAETAPPAAAN